MKLVCAIDVGIYNVGFAVWPIVQRDGKWTRPAGKVPYVERSTFLVRKDGRLYTEFEEKHAEELVEGWIFDRWHRWFKRSSLVLVERQISLSGKDRGCLVVERVLCALFRALQQFCGGPPYLAVSAQRWKRALQIKIGGHKKTAKKAAQHKANKIKDVEMYQELIGSTAPLTKEWGTKIDDMCDAALIGYFGTEHFEALVGEAAISSHHTHQFGTKTITLDRRMLPNPSWQALEQQQGRITLTCQQQLGYLKMTRAEKYAKKAASKKRKRTKT